ncbi:MAG: NAD-dependent epimerase/dehydratase family protein, partial [Deltaproteobacteria bacterium]|nr:NAD-dependent epimerase/dehydratase family protein [Deltaproteobacteria bacterium]
GVETVGIDIVNDYYDVELKYARLAQLGISSQDLERLQRGETDHAEGRNIRFYQRDIGDETGLNQLFERERPRFVAHLAAQAGVRYSLKKPMSYVESNLSAFVRLLECCREAKVSHLVYASSSSVYGGNRNYPYSVHQNVDHPISLYAATKKANELIAHAYAHLYSLPCTGLRFFTVYGPWGRPDMALFLFTEKILRGEPIDVFNHGKMKRDFTYIDDIVDGIMGVLPRIPEGNPGWDALQPDPSTSYAPFRIFNIGNHRPVELLHFISVIEAELGKAAKKNFLPMQPGDVEETAADIDSLHEYCGFAPAVTIEDGVKRFVEWYRDFKGIST